MSKLILHIGPGKCGSSSIQSFFESKKNPCLEKVHYYLLSPSTIREFSTEKVPENLFSMYKKLMSTTTKNDGVLILSHEVLSRFPLTIKNLCDIGKEFVADIDVVGYSRRQGEFMVSAYSQWYFRASGRIKLVRDILDELGVDPTLFSGVEQYLIASIMRNFDLDSSGKIPIQDWFNTYNAISNLVPDDTASIKCGVLPKRGAKQNLIQDFCNKVNITLRDEMIEASNIIVNPSFDKEVVEALNNALHLGLLESADFPVDDVRHDRRMNEAIVALSNAMNLSTQKHQDFLTQLKAYIDSYFLSSNKQLSQKYGLDKACFAPAQLYSKEEILSIIISESHQRAENMKSIIEDYRLLSAKMVILGLKVAFEAEMLKVKKQPLRKTRSLLKKQTLLYEKMLRVYSEFFKH